MPSWSTPIVKTSGGRRRGSVPVVRFSLEVTYRDSDGESLSSSTPSELSDPHLHELETLKRRTSACSRHLQDEDPEDADSRRHLDELGMALENTFKEVESIDAYVNKLRSDFDHEMVSEQRFMSCICSAKIARAACCKKQIEAWRELQHGLLDFCCHHHHHHEALNHHSDDCMAAAPCDGDTSSIGSQDHDIEAVVDQLSKLSTFDLVKQRLDPESDTKSFVAHWIMQDHHHDDHHH